MTDALNCLSPAWRPGRSPETSGGATSGRAAPFLQFWHGRQIVRRVSVKQLLICLLTGFALLATPALAQDNAGGQVGESVLTADDAASFKKPGYSPYAGRGFPTRVFWGDTHLHTNLSLDAGLWRSARTGRGIPVRARRGGHIHPWRAGEAVPPAGLACRERPLRRHGRDGRNRARQSDPACRSDPARLAQPGQQGGQTALGATMEVINAFTQGNLPKPLLSKQFANSIWDQYLRTAEKFNEPGRFTAIIGYEWTSTEDGNNLHRNVLYRDGQGLRPADAPIHHIGKLQPGGSLDLDAALRRKVRAGASWPSPITATSPTASCFRSRRTRPPANR